MSQSMPTDGLSLLSLSVAAANAQPIPESKHRRLSSTGKARRRLSDARDAASRPSPSSLSGTTPDELAGISSPVVIPKNGKKRGVDHKCESCSKIYRHPSCLIKHRWEHTPHWRESSKYVLSKHQQVQLLEAAAILSHLKSESLPEDRSLWPSFLSGGVGAGGGSSSVPVGRAGGGPRMHDYDVQEGTPMEVLAPRFEYGSVGESVPESDEEEDGESEEEEEEEVWEERTKQEDREEEWDGFDMDMD